MKTKNTKSTVYFACDFETVTSEPTYVWSVATTQLFTDTDDVTIDGSIDDWLAPFINNRLPYKPVIYFHNIKFDGSFILDWLFKNGFEHTTEYRLDEHQFSTMISGLGQFYKISVNINGNLVEFRDSLKLLPFTLKKLGHDFKTKHQKLDMQYTNKRSLADCTESDINYIKNDVLVLREALEIFLRDHEGLTIGSCCLKEFKKLNLGYDDYIQYNHVAHKLDMAEYGSSNADEYVRKSYHGGYCYCHRTGHFNNGVTYDYNSMYPSQMLMHRFPCGAPNFWTGTIPDEAMKPNRLFIVRFRCKFNLKNGKLPTVQIKNGCYNSNKWLTSSALYDREGNVVSAVERNGKIYTDVAELTMTSVDFQLFMENYNVEQLEILDGCWYYSEEHMFDSYINKYRRIKETSTGAVRQIAKLFLNNLYGKTAVNPTRTTKIPYYENGRVRYKIVETTSDDAEHIAIASFITSYARNEVIRLAQKNLSRLVYIDTDSLHLTGSEPPVDAPVHDTEFCHWSHESDWTEGLFIRQKTYAEKIDGAWQLRGCGLTERGKNLFLESVDGVERITDKSEHEVEFVSNKHSITDYNVGLSIPGKLIPKIVEGGVILINRDFTMKRG